MNEKEKLLADLRAVLERWEALLAGLSEAEITAPGKPGGMSIKDAIGHLRAWQQVSAARLEAALSGAAPVYAAWPAWIVDPDVEEDTDRINAWIHEAYLPLPWPEVHRQWREGFEKLIALGEAVPEADLLEAGRFTWLQTGDALSGVLIGTCEHHDEHLDEVLRGLGLQAD